MLLFKFRGFIKPSSLLLGIGTLLLCTFIYIELAEVERVLLFLLPTLSGASTLYFFYMAKSGQDHLLAFCLSLSTGILITLLFENGNPEKKYAFLYLNLFLFLFSLLILSYKWVLARPFNLKIEFTNLLFETKEYILFIYLGVYLIHIHPNELFIQKGILALNYQIAFCFFLKKLFSYLGRDEKRANQTEGEEKEYIA